MDSFEWNKIAGAVLFALLLSVGLSIFSDILFETEAPESPGYIIAVATEEGAEGGEAERQPIAALLASADPKAGESSAKKCAACHTFAQGEPNKIGPNLYGIVNRPIAAHEGYEYDEAMKAFAEQAGTWTFENLDAFLINPKGTVPGTKMAFAGLRNDAERANVIAYLRTLSDNPAPLPEAAAAEAPAETEVASAEPAVAGEAAAPQASGEAASEAAGEAAPAEQTAAAAAAEEPAQAEAPAEGQPAPSQEVAAVAPSEGDVAKGEVFAKRCTVCHSLEKDGPNKVGPHIFGVVDRPIAAVADFSYSDAMKEFAEGGAKTWDAATLDSYLADPRGVVPGTKMIFPGMKSEADRANVIAYLRTLQE